MRLAGKEKLGFFPAPEQAIAEVLQWVSPPGSGNAPSILDPCCGKGAALAQICGALEGVPYAIEIDSGRQEESKALLEPLGGTVLEPASMLGCRCSPNTFSMIWLNPPYDDEPGGGARTEHTFLARATEWLRPGGLMCLVCPERIAADWRTMKIMCERYKDVAMTRFPETHRKYREVVVFAVKLERSNPKIHSLDFPELAEPLGVYRVPAGVHPRVFAKVELTEEDVSREIGRSPLVKHLTVVEEEPLPEPPLPLATGHVAMLLAAGHLDGIVRPDGEAPHVVRGTAKKMQYISSVEESETLDGSVVTTTIQSEKIVLTVRTIDQDGNLVTLEQE